MQRGYPVALSPRVVLSSYTKLLRYYSTTALSAVGCSITGPLAFPTSHPASLVLATFADLMVNEIYPIMPFARQANPLLFHVFVFSIVIFFFFFFDVYLVLFFDESQEVQWPRELYLHVLGCKALVPCTAAAAAAAADGQHQRVPSEESLESSVSTASATTGVSRGTDGDTASGHVGISPANGVDSKGGVGTEGMGGDGDENVGGGEAVGVLVSPEQLVVENGGGRGRVQIAGADSYSSTDDDLEAGVANGVGEHGEAVEEGVDGGEEFFVRISNATTGRDLQVTWDTIDVRERRPRSTFFFIIITKYCRFV